MNKNLLITAVIAIILTACAVPKPPQAYDIRKSEASLAEASYSVSRSVVDLAETAQAAHPLPNLDPAPDPASYGMGGATSVDWSGPIEPLVRKIASAADYRVRVMGTSPAIPVIVTIYEKNAMLGDILRDASYQAGRRASVVVYPGSRIVELRYAKN